MLNILELLRLKIFVHLLLQRNLFITIVFILTIFYSVLYPLFLIVCILIWLKFKNHINYPLFFISMIIFFSGLIDITSNITYDQFTNKEIVIIEKQKQTYMYQYIVKDQQFKYIYHSYIDYTIGTKVIIDGEIIPFNKNTIPNGFHPKEYYLSKGIIGRLNHVKVIVVDEKTTIKEWFYDWKETYHETEVEPFIDAFIFDDQKELRTFSFEWLFYLFSVSGIHIFALSQLIIYLFKIRQMKFQIYTRLLIVILFFIFQPFHYSIIRLLLMNIAILCLSILRFQIPKYVILGMIWILILIVQPYKIYDIGLLISFFLVMNLYLSLEDKTHPIINQYHIILLAASLIFLFNGRFLLIPIIIMPVLVSVIIYTTFMPTLLMFILQIEIIFFIDWFNKLFDMFKIVQNYSGVIQLPMPSNISVSLAFIVIFFMHLSSSKKTIMKRLFVMCLIFLISGKLFVLNQPASLMFLDVGQGDATVYVDKDCVVVIDAFSNVESYLRSKGKQHIDYLFLTHSDLDHIKEAKSLVENMQVRHIITSPYQEIEDISTSTIDDFPTSFFCGDIKIDILGPIDTMLDDNDDSLMILINFLGKKILFTGDASKEREKQLITLINDDIDVLKVGHHGSKTSTSSELLYALKPEFGIISTSINNRYGMPHQEVINQLNVFHIKYFITSLDGSIQMTIYQGEIKWETYPP